MNSTGNCGLKEAIMHTTKTSEIDDWSTGSGHHYTNVRFGSGSSQASQSSGDICRICHCESDPQNILLTPCHCAGSLKYVHQACLQQWLTASETNACELCKFEFIMHTKIKPFNEWRSLDISGIERRRLCCSVLFHSAAALCVIWSLCVLIERAAEDVKHGLIDWPFWTKLAVVTVGLTGGVVFMYIQCKAYLHLCHRWKARNRILLIQNAPERLNPLMTQPVPSNQVSQTNVTASCSRLNHEVYQMPSLSPAEAGSFNATADNMVNMCITSNASNVYNFATTTGRSIANMDINSHIALHHSNSQQHDNAQQAQNHNQLDSSHHLLHMQRLASNSSNSSHQILQQADLSMLERDNHHYYQYQQYHPQPSHDQKHNQQRVAVSANIECSQSQHNYERDWALDDVISQISSTFRPGQGSGSMTPFLDSMHNAVMEHSAGGSSRDSIDDMCAGSRQDNLSAGGISSDTREHVLQLSNFSGCEHNAPSISSGVSTAVANGLGGFVYKPHSKRYSNSSIFLENRDILNDSDNLNEMESCGSGILEAVGRYPLAHLNRIMPASDCDENISVGATSTNYFERDVRRFSDTKLLDSSEIEVSIAQATSIPQQHNTSRRFFKQQSEANVMAASTIQDNINTRVNVNMSTVVGSGNSASHRSHFKSLPNLSSSCESLIRHH